MGITHNLVLFKGEVKKLGFRRFIYHKMREREEERKEGKKIRENREKMRRRKEKKSHDRLREVDEKKD
jgi:hypothetical protein